MQTVGICSEWVETFCRDYKVTRNENFENYRVYRQYTFMKPTGSLVNSNTYHDNNPRYSVHFDDGMTILLQTIDEELVYENMLSVGPDTYYINKGKWPTGKNLEKRIKLAIEYVTNNIKRNRYKHTRKN